MIIGPVTERKLADWLSQHRADLGLWEHQDTKGFYRRDLGPAASFRGIGPTWRDVAAALGATRPPRAR